MADRRVAHRIRARAFSLVELLIVLAIIGILVGMLLPAIQAARERSRRTVCANNLYQMSIAVHAHLAAHQHFPTGGWGANWTGDPNRGFGKGQPGGWVFNILPYLEYSALHDLSVGASGPAFLARQAEMMATPIELFNCPTRRAATLYPNYWPYPMANADVMRFVARGDYAVNVGDQGANRLASLVGPTDLTAAATYDWPSARGYTGISFVRSMVRARQVVDGFSKTYLAGEKYLNPEVYDIGVDIADRGHLLAGFSPDNFRMARLNAEPRQDFFQLSNDLKFGSAHAESMHFLFCDGSVRSISYSIAGELHQAFGNRRDGKPTEGESP